MNTNELNDKVAELEKQNMMLKEMLDNAVFELIDTVKELGELKKSGKI